MAIIQGYAGIQGASVALTGDATATVTADLNGLFTFDGLDDGSYTVTPTLDGYTFIPTSQDVTLADGASDIQTAMFGADSGAEVFSPPDCRVDNFNNPVNDQDSLLYVIPSLPSHPQPQDSRAAGAPVDSRVNRPLNSRAIPS